MSLPLRTRVFGVLVRLGSTPIEEVDDLDKARRERLGLQRTAIGRWLFGTADPSVRTTEHHVQVDGRARRFLQHRPTGAASPGSAPPVVLNLHGGGWVQGNPEQSAWFASRVAARTGAVVLSFDYRLAPEDPFPAAVDDAWAALQWVVEHAEELDVDPDRVAVMGDSAGGGLAATTALLARDAGAPRLKAEVLIYPGVEMYDRWPSEDEFADAPVLSSANMRAFVRLYLRDQHGGADVLAQQGPAEEDRQHGREKAERGDTARAVDLQKAEPEQVGDADHCNGPEQQAGPMHRPEVADQRAEEGRRDQQDRR
jgi:acetyl esterase